MKKSKFRINSVLLAICIVVSTSSSQSISDWYAGSWDASRRPSDEHPGSVAIRIEIVDSQTLIELQGVQVKLRGEYKEELLEISAHPQTQLRQWALSATTNEDGITVFALSWQKKFPWSLGRTRIPNERGGWIAANSWIRPVDDIEKVQVIEIRHPHYFGFNIPFDFADLLQFGQEEYSENQPWEIVDRFNSAWKEESEKDNVRLCFISLSENFPDFQNPASTHPEFFEAIRQKVCISNADFYRDVGPFLVYNIRVELAPNRDR